MTQKETTNQSLTCGECKYYSGNHCSMPLCATSNYSLLEVTRSTKACGFFEKPFYNKCEMAANKDEKWVGNSFRSNTKHLEELHAGGVKSARFGDIAYDIYGKPLSNEYAPVFIARSEEKQYDNFMMTKISKIFDPHWSRRV
jgi:hypothetical protein